MKKQEDKQLAGTQRATRPEQGRGDLTSLPRPPIALGKEGRKFWKALGELLIAEQLLCKTDVYALGQFAYWWEMGFRARQELEDKGLIQVFKTGARSISPELTAMERIDSRLQSYYRYFGMTPYHRERLVTTVSKDANASDTYADQWNTLLSVASN